VHADLIIALRNQGLLIETASEAGLARADDEAIFAHVKRTAQILLTADKDFGNIVRFDFKAMRGVVLIDVDRMSRETILRRTLAFFSGVSERRLHGTLWIVGIRGLKTWPK
jgi:predicted nuclease of predicted toxin-antitoxin system